MTTRKQQVEELLTGFQSLRRRMVFHSANKGPMPRVTPSQWGVLMLIEQHGTSGVKEISRALGISSSAATQLIDGLVENGYVVRGMSPQDRRAVTLTLSKQSKHQVGRMRKDALQKFLVIFKALNDKEFEQYVALTKKLVQKNLTQKTPKKV